MAGAPIKIGGAVCAGAIALFAAALVSHWPLLVNRISNPEGYAVRFALPPSEPANAARSQRVAGTDNAQLVSPAVPAPVAPAMSVPNATPVARVRSSPEGGVMDLRFDLADYPNARESRMNGSALEIRKPLAIDGTPGGEAMIAILPGSRLAIASEELERMLKVAGKEMSRVRRPAASADLYTFEELRDLGFQIHYDPVADRIQLFTQSSLSDPFTLRP